MLRHVPTVRIGLSEFRQLGKGYKQGNFEAEFLHACFLADLYRFP